MSDIWGTLCSIKQIIHLVNIYPSLLEASPDEKLCGGRGQENPHERLQSSVESTAVRDRSRQEQEKVVLTLRSSTRWPADQLTGKTGPGGETSKYYT